MNAPQDEDFTGYTTTQSQVSTPSFSPPRVCSVFFSAVEVASKKEPNEKQLKFETAESSLLYASRECDRKSLKITNLLELCTGSVHTKNESFRTLLAQVIKTTFS